MKSMGVDVPAKDVTSWKELRGGCSRAAGGQDEAAA